jgi:hypothetical protein
MEEFMKHSTSVAFDRMILTPILFACVSLLIYGVFFESGTWKHIMIAIFGIMVTSMIGQSLYPKATPSDLASGRAWDDNEPDNQM